jgi:hypothetical protein
MVFVNWSTLDTGFPLILFTLILGVLGLGLVVGYAGSVPYASVCCITVLVIGVLSGYMDSAIVAAALLAATAASSSEGARTSKRLEYLEEAVGTYIDAKRQLRQDTTTNRSC